MKLTLCMIVKNESKVIARALNSVKHLVDYYVILDTGSTDNTLEIAEETMGKMPGCTKRGEFKGFAASRTECLELAKRKFPDADYVLVLDADEILIDNGFDKNYLTKDCYALKYAGGLDYSYPVIFKNSMPFYYKYPTHEIPMCDVPYTQETLSSLVLDHRHDGGSVHEKYERDIRLIKDYLKFNPGDHRMMFYLANSYWDTGELILAKEYYIQRAELGGWDQEVFVSYYKAGMASLALGNENDFLKYSFLAFLARNDRPDSLYEIGKYYNNKGMHNVADLYLGKAVSMNYPKDPLFFDKAIFDYLIDIEYAVCCFYLNKHSKAIEYNQAVMCSPHAPQWAKDLAVKNMAFSQV